MKTDRLQKAWLSYRDQVLPANAGPVQIQESRRAFFAGADAYALEVSLITNDLAASEDEQVASVALLIQELMAFADEVKAGRA